MISVRQQYEQQAAWGILVSLDLHSCNASTIRSAEKIRQFVAELCKRINVRPFGECTVVHFGQHDKIAGYSMTQLIETSLISGHFANKTNVAYLDVFSCKFFEPETVAEFAKDFFEATDYIMHYTLRK